jgi:hypothetical protein
MKMGKLGHNLKTIVDNAVRLKQVRKDGLQFGDMVVINTRNSVYSLRTLSDGSYMVCGGWFDKKGLSPMKTTVRGCTWGGNIIKMDIVAACGLCVEFGNRVVTTPIRKVIVIPNGGEN